MNKKFLLLLPLMLAACAAPVSRVPVTGPEPVYAAPFNDLRPASEKENETFSYLITSGGYAIFRKGDATLSPNAAQLLRRRAYEKLAGADAKTPVDITVHHLVVYWNAKSETRKAALGGAIGGAIGGVVMSLSNTSNRVNLSQSLVDRTRFDGVADEYERAYYTTAENPDKASVYVTYIDAEINGKRVFTKTMAPSVAASGQDPYVVAMESSIAYFLSNFESTVVAAETH